MCRFAAHCQLSLSPSLPLSLSPSLPLSLFPSLSFSSMDPVTVTAPDGGTPYRGVMVQARTVPGNLAVGSFDSFTANTRASACTPPEVIRLYYSTAIG